MSARVRRDDEREHISFLRILERLAYIAVGFYAGYMLGLLAP